jgi:hypothetical protein
MSDSYHYNWIIFDTEKSKRSKVYFQLIRYDEIFITFEQFKEAYWETAKINRILYWEDLGFFVFWVLLILDVLILAGFVIIPKFVTLYSSFFALSFIEFYNTPDEVFSNIFLTIIWAL